MILNSPSGQIAFYIHNYPIKFYGLILSFSILAGIILGCFIFKKYNKEKEFDTFFDSYFYTIIFSIVGARVFYILGNLDFYINYPSEIIKINHGGISIWGAIIFGIISLYFYCKIKKTDFLKYLDYYSIAMPLSQAIGRWGNYYNQEAYGKPANGLIKLYIEPQNRLSGFENYSYFEPAFLYESILNFILFIILFIIFRRIKNTKGLTFLYYIFSYSIIRIIVENIRIDSTLNIAKIPAATILSVLALIISVIFIIKKTRQN